MSFGGKKSSTAADPNKTPYPNTQSPISPGDAQTDAERRAAQANGIQAISTSLLSSNDDDPKRAALLGG